LVQVLSSFFVVFLFLPLFLPSFFLFLFTTTAHRVYRVLRCGRTATLGQRLRLPFCHWAVAIEPHSPIGREHRKGPKKKNHFASADNMAAAAMISRFDLDPTGPTQCNQKLGNRRLTW